jgi:hypothetical protein
MEFTCSCNSAEILEKEIDKLTKKGYAKLVSMSKYKDGELDTSGFSTVKYEVGYCDYDQKEVGYDLMVKTNYNYSSIPQLNEYLNTKKEPIRFWYDRRYPKKKDIANGESENIRNDRAGVKITLEGIRLFAKILEIVGVLQEIVTKTSKGNAIDLDKVLFKLNTIKDKV